MSPPGGPLGGQTRLAGVIGDPVSHSLSPLLHNAAFAALGLDWGYGAFHVIAGDVPAAIAGARAMGFVGLSVTMPHKEAAARSCEQASATVERLGAANTVVFRAGIACAESTDGIGLLDDLSEAEGFAVGGRRCGVIGAGGAARAIVLALFEAGAGEVVVVNRTADRARDAALLAGPAGRVGTVSELGECDLVVNATPIGMAGVSATASSWPEGSGEPGVLLAAGLGPSQLVVDAVYHPAETPFLAAARATGARAVNGLGMLVGQAARQVELWNGPGTDLVEVRAAMRAALTADAGAP